MRTMGVVCLVLVMGTATAMAGGTACTCKDSDDLLNRLNEADNAIFQYNFEIALITKQEHDTGKDIWETPENYNRTQPGEKPRNSLQDRVQEVLDTVTNGKAN